MSPSSSPVKSILTTTLIILVVFALAIAAAAWWKTQGTSNQPNANENEISSTPAINTTIGAPFTLTNQNGEQVSDSQFRGKLMLVYFGFSHCPDVCPTDMQVISNTMKQLGAYQSHVQPIFISIDPERDTPERLQQFAKNFDPSIQLLTGSKDEIAMIVNGYKAFAQKVTREDIDEYLMNHSAFTYLMGPDGNYVRHFAHNTNPFDMARDIKALWDKIQLPE